MTTNSKRPRLWGTSIKYALLFGLLLLSAGIVFSLVTPGIRSIRAVATLRNLGFKARMEVAGQPTWLATIMERIYGEDVMATPLAVIFDNRQRPHVEPNEYVVYLDEMSLSDSQMELLREFRGLKDVEIYDQPLTARRIEQLSGLPLESLVLDGCVVGTGRCKTHVRENLVEAADGAIRELKTFTSLRTLKLSRSTCSDEDLIDISSIKALTGLWLDDTCVTDAGIAGCEPLHLEGLLLSNTLVSGVGFLNRSADEIYGVFLDGSPVDDTGLAAISAIPNLTELSIGNTLVTDTGCRALSGAKHLRHLNLRKCSISDETLDVISRLPNLRSADIADTRVTIGGLEKLKTCRELYSLSLSAAMIVDTRLPLVLSRMSKLRVVCYHESPGASVVLSDLQPPLGTRIQIFKESD